MQKKSIYVNRLESVIFSACNCVVYRPELNTKDGGCVWEGGGGGKGGGGGGAWNWILKISKCKNEIYQQIKK